MIIFHHVKAKSELKNFRQVFHHVQTKSELKNFRWDPGWSDEGGQSSFNFNAEPRNVSFALISFMGFPAILSTLQPFKICIYNKKYSKLTFFKWLSADGEKVYGKFACIIGEYMQK